MAAPRYTERTITDADALDAELERSAARLGAGDGEREDDLDAVAAPVPGRPGELAAILGIQGPS